MVRISRQRIIRQRIIRQRLRPVSTSKITTQEQKETPQQAQQKAEQEEIERNQLRLINSLNTYKGGNTEFGQRLFSRSPSYSYVTLEGAGTIALPYFQGTYYEYDPKRNKIITYSNPSVQFGSRGNPLNPEGKVIKIQDFNPVSNRVVDAFNQRANNWVSKVSTSQQKALEQRQKIAGRLSAEALLKSKKKLSPSEQRLVNQDLRVAFNTRQPKGQKVTSGEWNQMQLLRQLADPKTELIGFTGGKKLPINKKTLQRFKQENILNSALKIAKKKKVGFFDARDRRLADLSLKLGLFQTFQQKILNAQERKKLRNIVSTAGLNDAVAYLRGSSLVSEKLEKKIKALQPVKIYDPNEFLYILQLKNIEKMNKYIKNAKINISYYTPKTGEIKIIQSIPGSDSIKTTTINLKTGKTKIVTTTSPKIRLEILKDSKNWKKLSKNIKQTFSSKQSRRKFGKGFAEFFVNVVKGGINQAKGIKYQIKLAPKSFSFYFKLNKISNELNSYNKKQKAGTVTNKDVERLKKAVEKIKITPAEKKQAEKDFQLMKKYLSSNEAKLFRTILYFTSAGIVSSFLGGVPLLATSVVGTGFIGAALGQTAFQFIQSPTPQNLGRLAFITTSAILAVTPFLRGKKGIIKKLKVNGKKITYKITSLEKKLLKTKSKVIRSRINKQILNYEKALVNNKLLQNSIKKKMTLKQIKVKKEKLKLELTRGKQRKFLIEKKAPLSQKLKQEIRFIKKDIALNFQKVSELRKRIKQLPKKIKISVANKLDVIRIRLKNIKVSITKTVKEFPGNIRLKIKQINSRLYRLKLDLKRFDRQLGKKITNKVRASDKFLSKKARVINNRVRTIKTSLSKKYNRIMAKRFNNAVKRRTIDLNKKLSNQILRKNIKTKIKNFAKTLSDSYNKKINKIINNKLKAALKSRTIDFNKKYLTQKKFKKLINSINKIINKFDKEFQKTLDARLNNILKKRSIRLDKRFKSYQRRTVLIKNLKFDFNKLKIKVKSLPGKIRNNVNLRLRLAKNNLARISKDIRDSLNPEIRRKVKIGKIDSRLRRLNDELQGLKKITKKPSPKIRSPLPKKTKVVTSKSKRELSVKEHRSLSKNYKNDFDQLIRSQERLQRESILFKRSQRKLQRAKLAEERAEIRADIKNHKRIISLEKAKIKSSRRKFGKQSAAERDLFMDVRKKAIKQARIDRRLARARRKGLLNPKLEKVTEEKTRLVGRDVLNKFNELMKKSRQNELVVRKKFNNLLKKENAQRFDSKTLRQIKNKYQKLREFGQQLERANREFKKDLFSKKGKEAAILLARRRTKGIINQARINKQIKEFNEYISKKATQRGRELRSKGEVKGLLPAPKKTIKKVVRFKKPEIRKGSQAIVNKDGTIQILKVIKKKVIRKKAEPIKILTKPKPQGKVKQGSQTVVLYTANLKTNFGVIPLFAPLNKFNFLSNKIKQNRFSQLGKLILEQRHSFLPKQVSVMEVKQVLKQKSKQIQKPVLAVLQKQLQNIKSDVVSVQRLETLVKQASKLASKQKQALKTKQVLRQALKLKLIQPPPPIVPPPFIFFKQKQIKNPRGFYAYGKKAGRKAPYKRLTSYPFKSEASARNYARYMIDNTLMASFFILPTLIRGKKTFTKGTNPNKFRKPKKKSMLPPKARIEKRKYRLDTSGEKRQIKSAQRSKRKLKKRKITVKQRRIMLMNLIKARRAKKNKLKKPHKRRKLRKKRKK